MAYTMYQRLRQWPKLSQERFKSIIGVDTSATNEKAGIDAQRQAIAVWLRVNFYALRTSRH